MRHNKLVSKYSFGDIYFSIFNFLRTKVITAFLLRVLQQS